MVIDVGAALAGDFAAVRADIAAVRSAIPDAVLKVIIESAALMSLADADTVVRCAGPPPTPGPTSSRRRRAFIPPAARRCLRCR